MNLKNIIWNLCGLGVPVLCAALTIPWLIDLIGLERFGLLSVAWGLIAQAGLFDLGIGRATTQYVAKLLGLSRFSEIPTVIGLAAFMTLITGFLVAGLFLVAILLGVQDYIKASPDVAKEIKWAAMVLAATLPVQAVSATYRGINEAYADFRGISLVRIFLGVVNFLGPFLVALFTVHLAWLVSTLLVSRLIGVIVYRGLAMKHSREDVEAGIASAAPRIARRPIARELLGFGGWFTFGSVVSFALNQSEKLAIGVLISAAAISAFAIPFEVVIQSLAVATAISTIAFPQLSTLVQQDHREALNRFNSWLAKTLFVMGGICLVMAGLLPPVLGRWIGAANLPPEASFIGQVLCVGVFARTINVLCFSMIHAYGRADLTTKIRMVEFPIHFAVLYFLVVQFGVCGAAYAWVIRMIVDSLVLYLAVRAISVAAEDRSERLESNKFSEHDSGNLTGKAT